MPTRVFTQPGALDPETIATMTGAFDAAREKLMARVNEFERIG
jgi:hypothetical protein